ncbi:MAG: UvrD-helicase domain-containing protein, partial [Clostridia bacterium]|nr:UvrD-helicase domain-containing protein [Clostridia bacterium]
GFNIAPPKRDKEKDIAEIYDIKGEYLECKAEFTKKLSLIFTTEIKKLPISKMQDDLFKTEETLSKLFDVVDEFDEEYTRLKQNYDILDFCDIETLANRILKNKVIAESLQNRYDWIFIDEYQDTSLLQEDIVKKITTNENLFMVGDLKQSIYRFRQAEPQIFINKYRQYKDMKSGSVIELKTNFRSEIDILEFDNFIFDHIYTQSLDDYQYKNNADLEYGRDDKQKNADKKVKLIVVEKNQDSKNDGSDESGDFAQNDEQSNAVDGSSAKEETDAKKIVYSVKNSEIVKDEEKSIETEAMILADEITKITKKRYYDAKSKTYKPIKYGDIAVLLRSGKDLFLQVGKILQKAGIPIQTSLEENLFDSIDMQILLNILKTIENQKDDIPLLSAMVNIGHFSFDELALIRSVFKEEKFFYNAVDLYALNHNDDLSTKIKAFFVKIDGYKRISQYMTISELILEIVAGEKLDEHFTINQYCKNFDSHLNLLLASIKSINQYSLSEFVDYVDTFADSIKIQNNVKDAENAVTISTIHASKGLEYPVVFLIGCGKNLLGKHDGMLSMDNDWGIAMNSIDAVERTSYKSLIKIGFEQKIKQE